MLTHELTLTKFQGMLHLSQCTRIINFSLIRYQVMRKVHVMFDHPSYVVGHIMLLDLIDWTNTSIHISNGKILTYLLTYLLTCLLSY